MSVTKKLLFCALTVVLVLLLVELASMLFFRSQADEYTFYDPSRFAVDDDDLPKLTAYFHPVLGWKKPFDTPFGERPRQADYGKPLLATFGDSYTYCDDVDDDETWQTYLAQSLRRDVFNFGHNAYGPDQAYLRFKEDYPQVRTPVVTLGLTADNIKRIVNVYRKFFYRKTGVPATKPRFVLDGDGLRLIENPIRSVDQLERLRDLDFLARIGENDVWYNKNDYPQLAFPYTRILFDRSFWLEVEHGKLGNDINDIDPRPWVDLWEDAEAREIMFRIFDRFVADAEAMGAAPVVMILPKRKEVRQLYRQGRHRDDVQLFLDHTTSRGYVVFDAIQALRAEARSYRDISRFFDGHVSPAGNAAIARRLEVFLQERGLLVHAETLEAPDRRDGTTE